MQKGFYNLRRAYDLYGYVSLRNAVEGWQVDLIEKIYDGLFAQLQSDDKEGYAGRKSPVFGAPLEESEKLLSVLSRCNYVLDCLHAVAGSDCQYLGSDLLKVYDDSIGPHRDTLYDFDTPKILFFLSDCKHPDSIPPEESYRGKSAGSFAVLSGSQYPDSLFSNLASQLSDWPDRQSQNRELFSPGYLRGDVRDDGDYLYPYLDLDTRYQGYSLIPFRRGDVVIFSTRALHALLPSYSSSYSKLFGVLFIEGYSKISGKCLPGSFEHLDDRQLSYVSLPYNLRIADAMMKGLSYSESLKTLDRFPMGLQRRLDQTKDEHMKKVFTPATSIYRMARENIEAIRSRCFADEAQTLSHFMSYSSRYKSYLDDYLSQIHSAPFDRFSTAQQLLPEALEGDQPFPVSTRVSALHLLKKGAISIRRRVISPFLKFTMK